MKIYLKSRNNRFNAEGTLKDDKIILLKGSKVSKETGNTIGKTVKAMREDSQFIDNNGIVLKDIEFNSASLAAQFVSGHSTNGLRAWKDTEGKSIGNSINGKGRKKKNNAKC